MITQVVSQRVDDAKGEQLPPQGLWVKAGFTRRGVDRVQVAPVELASQHHFASRNGERCQNVGAQQRAQRVVCHILIVMAQKFIELAEDDLGAPGGLACGMGPLNPFKVIANDIRPARQDLVTSNPGRMPIIVRERIPARMDAM